MSGLNGADTPQGYNWESLAAAALASVAAVLTVVWPGHPIPAAVQATVTGIAGILVLLHVHVPKVVTHLFRWLWPVPQTTSSSSSSFTFSGNRVGAKSLSPAEAHLVEAVRAVRSEEGSNG